MTTDQVTFVESDRPTLEPGEYSISVEQTVIVSEVTLDGKVVVKAATETFTSPTKYFSIEAERFSLQPSEITAVFPPADSMGDHANVLPHVVLGRSTLPWERRAEEKDPAAPWLALLVFHAEEAPAPVTVRLGELVESPGPGHTLEDRVTVIDVPRSVLSSIMPLKTELGMLTHVRERNGIRLAVVIANRLPLANGFSTAHLVSVEHRYEGEHFKLDEKQEHVRLVSLRSFRFGCVEHTSSFTSLLEELNHAPATLRLPDDGTSAVANQYLAAGAVPLLHRTRQGDKSVSFYQGPLATAVKPLPEVAVPSAGVPRAADELLRFNPSTGMFNVSHAAAWELGRLLALQSKSFSVRLHAWKRAQARSGQRFPLWSLIRPSVQPLAELTPSLDPPLRDWISHLCLLEGVPFSYLVPDERMLPVESIRFFGLDREWIDALRDGACSIGRFTEADRQRDARLATEGWLQNPHGQVTGVLLRSQVVSGWPGLLVDGYDGQSLEPLEVLRMERLSPNVLLCLFKGELKKVIIHQRPEMLHFGVDSADERGFLKGLRDGAGELILKKKEDGTQVAVCAEVAWPEGGRARGVVDLAALVKGIQARLPSFSPVADQLALQMIQGVQAVTFEVGA